MDMRVDQARQHVQPGRIDHLRRRGIRRHAERGNPALADPDIGLHHAPGQHAVATLDHQIELLGHPVIFLYEFLL